MAKADLTAERLQELLEYNPVTGVFQRKGSRRGAKAGSAPGYINKHLGYRYICIDSVEFLAHRLAWLYVHKAWPAGFIDHINGDKSDNRIENLRVVSNRVNMQNMRESRKSSSSGLLGVSKHTPGRWTSGIRLPDGSKKYLGIFSTPEEAHEVYLTAKRKLHEGCTI